MLKINQFSLTYDNIPILQDVNLSFKPGEITVLTGTSGCGKSSLLKAINGVIPYFQPAELSGQMIYQHQNLLDLDMAERSSLVASVFQNPKTQFYAVNSTDEMAFALENRNLPAKNIFERINYYTNLLQMQDLLNRDIFTLSGGEKQLLAITSVACMDNDIYLFDEPSSSLDREAISRFKHVLKKLKELGKIIIIAEHRLYYLKDIMDQFVLISDKQAQVYPLNQLTQAFIDEKQLRALEEISKTELIKICSYQKQSKYSSNQSNGKLICQRYSYQHDDQPKKIFDFNLGIDQGINFIIGKNGIGKTTFLRCLSGLNKKFKGKTYYDKKLVKPSYKWLSEVVQDVNYQLFTESVWSEISLVSDDDVIKKDALTQFGLISKLNRHPQSLSGGEKQRLLLAMAKASNKPIIVLDEPTSGLCRQQMDKMIEDLQQMSQTGKIIIVVTHDYELIKHCKGRIIEFVE
ncbi:ATP-binding cassette domain-containing protein [Streptococcus ruminicola]|uniref:ATP-binding cassette domain-containing protein n=1 Tax=Streptococcus ruminicola TaxID=2686210 RepID=A0AAE6UYC3_9STRE|nr:ABC transporter ATP-binding protein [Streptococcus ruminicola]QGZ27213.1 ATP-binding cassette domain-containing protein [Streptococcus ruminicola]